MEMCCSLLQALRRRLLSLIPPTDRTASRQMAAGSNSTIHSLVAFDRFLPARSRGVLASGGGGQFRLLAACIFASASDKSRSSSLSNPNVELGLTSMTGAEVVEWLTRRLS